MAAWAGHSEARDFCDKLAARKLAAAHEHSDYGGAFLVDLAQQFMLDEGSGSRTLDSSEQGVERFRVGSRMFYQEVRGGTTLSDLQDQLTRSLRCLASDLRPFLDCWFWAASELLDEPLELGRSADAMCEDFQGWLEDYHGFLYQRGSLAHRDEAMEQAEAWFTKAAEQGHAKAAYSLAMMYWNGEIEDLPMDEQVLEAVARCEDAAQHGIEEAQEFLARGLRTGLDAYRRGKREEAEQEFRRIAEQSGGYEWSSRADRAEAAFRIARMYREEEIVRWREEVDAQEGALQWFRRSAELGFARAIYGMYATLSGIYDLLDFFDPVIHGGLEAPKWHWKATELEPDEQYMAGLGSEADVDHPDEKEAEFWYRLAADRGHTDAQFRLGMIRYLKSNADEEEEEGKLRLVGAAADGHDGAASLAASFIAREEGEELDPTDLFANYGFRVAPMVGFPIFAKEMLAKHLEPAGAIRPLLRGLYATYRSAARVAGADQTNELSSDAEIEDWYADPPSNGRT